MVQQKVIKTYVLTNKLKAFRTSCRLKVRISSKSKYQDHISH